MPTPLEEIIAALEAEAETIAAQQSELTGRLESLRTRVKDLSKRLTEMAKGPKSTGAKRGRKPKVTPETQTPTALADE